MRIPRGFYKRSRKNSVSRGAHFFEARFLSDYVKEGGTVLDVGCGTGKSLEPIIGRVSKAHGIDFSRLMLSEARKNLGWNTKLKLTCANAENLPFADDTFDHTICMGNTYGNFEDPDRCLAEMLRVTKPEGSVVLGVYSPPALETQLETYKQIGLNVERVDKNAVYLKEGLRSKRFSKEELERTAKRHGAQIELRELTSISHIAILQKNNGQMTNKHYPNLG